MVDIEGAILTEGMADGQGCGSTSSTVASSPSFAENPEDLKTSSKEVRLLL
jgi:hypothetical protein